MTAEAVYGAPPRELAAAAFDARQVSPLVPESEAIEDLADASLDRAVILAPPGTLERRYVLAQALRALRPGGEMTALAPKTKGGTRLGKELAAFGCTVHEDARRHHRICRLTRPEHPVGIAAAVADAAARVGGRMTLMGNVSPLEIGVRGTPDEVAAATRGVLQNAGTAPLILSVGGGVSMGMPAANIRAMIGALAEFNRQKK